MNKILTLILPVDNMMKSSVQNSSSGFLEMPKFFQFLLAFFL